MTCVICGKTIYDRACRGAHQGCYARVVRAGAAHLLPPPGKPGRKPAGAPRPATLPADVREALARGESTLRRQARRLGMTPAELKEALYG